MTRALLASTLLLFALGATAAPVERYLYVPGDGDGLANGQALASAVAATAQAPGEPWLIQLGPGFFNISPATLELPVGVNLIGAGRQATTVRLNNHGSPPRPAMRAWGNNELSRLQLVGSCLGAVESCTALEVPAGAGTVRLNDVVVLASGGSGTNTGVAAGAPVVVVGSLVLAQTGKRAVAVDLMAAGVLRASQTDLNALAASQRCEAIGGKSTATEPSQVRHSALYPYCVGSAQSYWQRVSTPVTVRMAFTRVVAGIGIGGVSCLATEAPSGFLAEGCPD